MTRQLARPGIIAFNELENKLIGSPKLKNPQSYLSGLSPKSPLFITWTKHGRLRGCIGTFAAHPTLEGIREYALIAALEDLRFKPIGPKELPDLEVAVTLLTPLEPIHDKFDWELGKHGVKAIFPSGESSTFLPDVMTEQGWTKEQTLDELAAKAGVNSTDGVEMFRYEGLKSKLTYKEYKELLEN